LLFFYLTLFFYYFDPIFLLFFYFSESRPDPIFHYFSPIFRESYFSENQDLTLFFCYFSMLFFLFLYFSAPANLNACRTMDFVLNNPFTEIRPDILTSYWGWRKVVSDRVLNGKMGSWKDGVASLPLSRVVC